MTAPIVELEQAVDRWRAWYRVRQMVNWAARGLALGLMAAFGLTLVARLRAVFSFDQLIQYVVAAGALGLIAGALAALLRPRSRLAAARYFDRVFDLCERTSTAFELAQRKIDAPEWLAEQQLADAVQAAQTVQARALLPIRLALRDLLAVLLAAALTSAALIIPNEQFAVLAQQRAVQQAVAREVKQLEAIRRQVESNNQLNEEQMAELMKPLNEAIQQLQTGDLSQEQVVSILSQAEGELRQLADPSAMQQAQALQSAGQQLAQNDQTRAAGELLQNNDLSGAASALNNLNVSQLSGAEQQQLASSLEQAAQSLAGTNPEVADRLQQAADALRRGDAQSAQNALNEASQQLQATASQVAQAQAASLAAQQVGADRQSIAQTGGQFAPQGAGQGPAQAQGAGQAQEQGPNVQGPIQGQGQGQGQGAGGAGRGESNNNAPGGQAGTNSIGGSNGPGDGGLNQYEPIYAPYRLGGSGGPEVGLPGAGDAGSQVVGQGPSRPPTEGGAQVPYSQVYQQYNQAAQHAISSGQAPVRLKPVIRNYFSSLEP